MWKARRRPYKRTWKNLLINKRYQLRFTLFMVLLSALLMGLLGWCVMAVAARATTVAVNNVLTACQDLPGARPDAPAAEPESAPPDQTPQGKRPRPVVTIDDSGMADAPPRSPSSPPVTNGPSREQLASYQRCRAAVPAKVKKLEDRERLIFCVLVGVGVLMTIGLMLYGIKMTHKVAGPLHKVTLYMDKLRKGLYDEVYAVRKGDHLVEFYDHFKAAHAGMRTLQEEDVARLRALVTASEQAELAARSAELAAALDDLRGMLERKEKSLA